MAISWPNTLPQKIESSGFGKDIGNNVIRSSMEVGLDKLRKRYTKQINKLTRSMQIDRTQYAVLENFYLTTLNSGITPFEFVDPISNVLTVYRFLSPPSFKSIGGNYFSVQLNWEQLP